MQNEHQSRFCLYCIFLLLIVFRSFAQGDGSKDKINLIPYLDSLAHEYEVSFSYNPTILSGFKIPNPNKNINDHTPDLAELLRQISDVVAVKFEMLEAGNYLVIPQRTAIRFFVSDLESGKNIPIVYIQVNNEKMMYLLPKDTSYHLSNLFPTDSIIIQTKFYLNTRVKVADLMSSGGIYLTPDTIYLDEVAIVAYMTSGINSRLSDHSLQVDLKNLGLLAGETDGDILQLLKSIPGIRTPDGKPGSFNMRGSTFDQNLIYFDDIPIYHTGHFFGTFSPYNPGVVDKITVQRGTLPSKFGGRVGGLVDIRTSCQIPDSAQYGIQVNSVYSSGKVTIPIFKNKLGLLLSARANYPIDYLSPKLKAFSDLNFQGSKIDPHRVNNTTQKLELFDVRFQDINGKLVYDINAGNQATVSFLNINNDFAFDYNTVNLSLLERQRVVLDNKGVSGKWSGQLSRNLMLSTSIVNSNLNIVESNKETENGVSLRDDKDINSIHDLRLLGDGVLKINNKSSFEFGYQWVKYKVEHIEIQDGFINDKNKSQTSVVHSAYASLKKGFGEKLTYSIGIHSDYYDLLDKTYTDPRVSFSYKVTNRFYLKTSTGRAHQYLKKELSNDFDDFRAANQFWFLADRESQVLVGRQLMIGGVYELPGWLIDLEVYSKKTEGISQSTEVGNLISGGADLFVKKRWRFMETWMAYSYSYVKTNFIEVETAFFDQPHVLNLMHLIHLKQWEMSVSWSLLSGTPVRIPDESEMDPDDALDIPYGNRFPFQHQMDLSATFRFPKSPKKYQGIIGFSLLNLYNQKNIINIFQQNPKNDHPYRQAVGVTPNLQIGFNF